MRHKASVSLFLNISLTISIWYVNCSTLLHQLLICVCLFSDKVYQGYCEGVVGNFNAENVHFVELDPRVLDSLDSEQYSEGNDYYENRRMSDSWRSSTTWQSDQLDGHAASTSSINSFPSEGGRDRPYYSRTSIDSSWTGSSLPSIRSRQSHDYARPSIPWHDMQNPMRSSQSLSKLSSLGKIMHILPFPFSTFLTQAFSR